MKTKSNLIHVNLVIPYAEVTIIMRFVNLNDICLDNTQFLWKEICYFYDNYIISEYLIYKEQQNLHNNLIIQE